MTWSAVRHRWSARPVNCPGSRPRRSSRPGRPGSRRSRSPGVGNVDDHLAANQEELRDGSRPSRTRTDTTCSNWLDPHRQANRVHSAQPPSTGHTASLAPGHLPRPRSLREPDSQIAARPAPAEALRPSRHRPLTDLVINEHIGTSASAWPGACQARSASEEVTAVPRSDGRARVRRSHDQTSEMSHRTSVGLSSPFPDKIAMVRRTDRGVVALAADAHSAYRVSRSGGEGSACACASASAACEEVLAILTDRVPMG